jgi:hypothetical protein
MKDTISRLMCREGVHSNNNSLKNYKSECIKEWAEWFAEESNKIIKRDGKLYIKCKPKKINK